MDMDTKIPQQPDMPQPQPVYQQPAPQPVYRQPVPPVQPQPVYQQPVYYQPAQPQPVYQQPAPQPVYRQPAPPVQPQPAYQQPVYYQPVQPQPVYYVPVPTPPPAQPAPAKKADDRIPDRRFPLISVICLSVSIAYGIYAALVPLFTSGNWSASVTDFVPLVLMLLGACLCKVRKDRLFAWGLLSMGILSFLGGISNNTNDLMAVLKLLIQGGMTLSFIALAVCYFIGKPAVKVLKLVFVLVAAALWLAAVLFAVLTNLHMPIKYHVDVCLRYVLSLLPIYIAVFFYTPFKK